MYQKLIWQQGKQSTSLLTQPLKTATIISGLQVWTSRSARGPFKNPNQRLTIRDGFDVAVLGNIICGLSRGMFDEQRSKLQLPGYGKQSKSPLFSSMMQWLIHWPHTQKILCSKPGGVTNPSESVKIGAESRMLCELESSRKKVPLGCWGKKIDLLNLNPTTV